MKDASILVILQEETYSSKKEALKPDEEAPVHDNVGMVPGFKAVFKARKK
jgi:hypothetical protein